MRLNNASRGAFHPVWTSAVTILMMNAMTIAAQKCPEGTGTISISGDLDSMYAVKGFKEVFEKNCPSYIIDYHTEAERELGMRQVCNENLATDQLTPVDIGGMAREFEDDDAQVTRDDFTDASSDSNNEYTMKCKNSDRELVQILVAHDALAFAVKRDTFAERCLQSMPGQGLTLDQLRWIYSSYTEEQLIATGWDPASVPNSDHNDAERKWEALGGTRCFSAKIDVAGVQSISDHFLKTAILPDHKNGEAFRSDYYYKGAWQDVQAYMVENQNTLGIFWYGSVADRPEEVFLSALENRQTSEYAFPSPNGIASLAYSLSRQIYLNVHKDPAVLAKVGPFFEHGYSLAGDQALESWQFVPITPVEKSVMRARLGSELAVNPADAKCGTTSGQLVMAGSAAVYPLAGIWGGVHHVLCKESIQVVVDGGDATEGARRVCDQNLLKDEYAVDIGEMDRDWHGNEATTHDGWTYDCKHSDRNVVQIQVAVESVTIVTARSGPAHRCLTKLKGLTLQQVRWIYSSLKEEQMNEEADGWIPHHSDKNDKTHLWKELDPFCEAMEILLAGPDDRNAGYHFLSEAIFNREVGETFSQTRDITTPTSTGFSYYPANSAADLVKYVTTNADAIGFMTSNEVAAYRDVLYEVPIMSKSEQMIAPDPLNIFDGRYPLMQQVYMNLNKEPASLQLTQPFIEFGLSDAGQHLAEYAGYTRLSDPLRTVMHTRAQTAMGIHVKAIEQTQKRGCATHSIKASGAGPAVRLVDFWSGIYEVACGITFHSSTVGSQYSAARVCAEEGAGSAVEVALMTRPVLANEATPREGGDGTVFDCVKGDKSRSLIQAHIASDGLAFAVKKGGLASECINRLGGLSMDQIRWMFSSFSEDDLAAHGGWDPNSIPNSDNDPATHKWSELHAECEDKEIQIAGLNGGSSAYTFFAEVVFKGEKESAASERKNPYFFDKEDHEVAQYVENNPEAIGFFSSFIYTEVALNQNSFAVVPIQNRAGNFVRPTSRTVNDGTYDHFEIPLYMLILHEPTVLKNIIPFLHFAFSEDGTDLVESAGYGPVPSAEIKVIMANLEKAAGEGTKTSQGGGLSGGAAFGIAIACLAVVLVVGYVVKRKTSYWLARKDIQTTNNLGDASPPYSDNPYTDNPEEQSGGIPDAMLA